MSSLQKVIEEQFEATTSRIHEHIEGKEAVRIIQPVGTVALINPVDTTVSTSITFAPSILTRTESLVTLEGTATMTITSTSSLTSPTVEIRINPPLTNYRSSSLLTGLGELYVDNQNVGGLRVLNADNQIVLRGGIPNQLVGPNRFNVFFSVKYTNVGDPRAAASTCQQGGYGLVLT